MKNVTSVDVKYLENSYEEWCMDIADISISLSEKYSRDKTIRNLFVKMMDEKYPDVIELCKIYTDDNNPYDENIIHYLCDEKLISKEKYYEIMAEVYNLNDQTNKVFWQCHDDL